MTDLTAVSIRVLKAEDITTSCLYWYRDPRVVEFSDHQYRNVTLSSQRCYVEKSNADENVMLFGIFFGGKYVGNVQLSDVMSNHKRCEVSYLVGESSCWGKGVASSAVGLVVERARRLGCIKKLVAGVSEFNFGSQKVLEKNGFDLEGRRVKHLMYGGKFQDQLDYALFL
jgi:RimJ/RimL family protein N-acetyltransferase